MTDNWKTFEEEPDKPGDICLLIGDKVFRGSVIFYEQGVLYFDERTVFELAQLPHTCSPTFIPNEGRGWIIPSHLKDPSHWCYLPE